jgi:succinyl-CoA synthetase beta subunit
MATLLESTSHDDSIRSKRSICQNMKIHEYQARQLLRDGGIPVPDWEVITGAEQAATAFDRLGGKLAVIKAQVHAGGRGKGGGVKLAKTAAEAREKAAAIFSKPLVTPQTGPAGKEVLKIIVANAADISREIYVGMVVDRARALPVIMACSEGGMEIEEVAARSPQKIITEPVDPRYGLQPFQARKLAFALELHNEPLLKQAIDILIKLVSLFAKHDCSLAEINPLVVTPHNQLVAIDAKITFDDNAEFRHPEWDAMRDPTEENPAERQAHDAGLSYVSLDGNIGCLVNGAGLAMSTMDIIKLHGGEPANFLDVGGGANKEQVTTAFRILLADSKVRAVLVNIFGGIMKCDTIAGAIIAAYNEVGFQVPLVVRLEGTNVELGRKMLAESGLPISTAKGLTEAAQKVVAAARGAAST